MTIETFPSRFPVPAAAARSFLPTASGTHLVLIPSYNPGSRVYETVRLARAQWTPVWVVVDGSTDGSAEALQAMAAQDEGLKVWVLPHNVGKGAAVLHGLDMASKQRFTHVLTLDSDGQHPAHLIAGFMAASAAQPAAMVLGVPVFAADAPRLRVNGRKVSNGWANLETLWAGIGDSLFGFRCHGLQCFGAAIVAAIHHHPYRRPLRTGRTHRLIDPGTGVITRYQYQVSAGRRNRGRRTGGIGW